MELADIYTPCHNESKGNTDIHHNTDIDQSEAKGLKLVPYFTHIMKNNFNQKKRHSDALQLEAARRRASRSGLTIRGQYTPAYIFNKSATPRTNSAARYQI